MPSLKENLWMAVVAPMLLGLSACIFSTADPYDDTYYEGGSGGPSRTHSTCNVGAPGCPCTITGVCDEGLVCVDSIATCVVPDPCPIGAAGCDCTAAGTCDEGLICKESYCVSEQPCLPEQTGTESCQCTEGGGCDPGLACLSGLCVDPGPATTGEGSSTGEPDPEQTTGEGSTTDPTSA